MEQGGETEGNETEEGKKVQNGGDLSVEFVEIYQPPQALHSGESD